MKINPKSNSPMRLLLNELEAGEDFKNYMTKYIRPLIVKGVPSVINDMKTLYKDQAKAKIIGDILLQMSENMEKDMVISKEDEQELDPTV